MIDGFHEVHRVSNLSSGSVYLAPGDEVNLLVLKKFPEGRTGEEIEVTLAPGCTPGIALTCCSVHFAVSEREMNNELGDPGLKVLECVDVKGIPLLRRDVRGNGNGVVNDDIVGPKAGFKIRTFRKPIPSHKERKFVLVRQAKGDSKEVLTVLVEPILMGIEVGRMDSHGVGSLNLSAQFDFGLYGVDVSRGSPIVEEITVGVEKAGDEIT